MPNTTGYSFGDVVLLRFPFSDQRSAKQRPAVVVSSEAFDRDLGDLVVLAITSSGTAGSRWSRPLAGWKRAGLLKPSSLKPALATIEKGLVRRKLGRLGARDRSQLRDLLLGILEFQGIG